MPPWFSGLLVPVPRRVVLGADHETTAFLCASIDSFDDVDHLALVLQEPIQLVVVTRSKIAHHVLVPEEEHNGHRIVKLVHGLEIRYFIDITDVDDRKVLNSVGNLVENLVLCHAQWIGVASKSDDD